MITKPANPNGLDTVQILLSTYNGERYIAEQLDSLINQDYPNIHVRIRDDGSTDETKRLIRPYLSENIRLLEGENVGVVKSFFELLEQASPEASYFAFCDQDDVWLPQKISRAVKALESLSARPALYCSRLILTDVDLTEIGRTPLPRRGATFANSLVENVVVGCTAVLNQKARNTLVKNVPRLEDVVVHDWWFYQVVSAIGHVIYDPEPSILYRQHAANSVGASSSLWGRWTARVKRINNNSGPLRALTQAEQIHLLFSQQLTSEQEQLLDSFLSCTQTPTARLRSALFSGFYRQSPVDEVLLRTLIAIGRF